MPCNKPNCLRVKQASTVVSFRVTGRFIILLRNHRTGLLNAKAAQRGTDFTSKWNKLEENKQKKMQIAR